MDTNYNQSGAQSPTDQVEELVAKFGNDLDAPKEEVIYGVYDNARESLTTRMNDFFIDRTPIAMREKAYFYYLMAIMLDAGLSVTAVLKILARRTTNEHFRRVLNTLAYNIERGRSLSSAMERFPVVFNESEIGIIRSGEAVGHLDQLLFKLSKTMGRDYEFMLKIKTALTYPITVLCALFLAGGVLTFYVVPQLTQFFTQSGAKLPFMTQVFISVSHFLVSFWWIFLIAILGGFIFLSMYRQTDVGRLKTDYYLLKIPVIGDLLKRMILVKFMSLLEILMASGLSITKILSIIGRSMGNEVYRKKMRMVLSEIETGAKFSQALKDAPFLFPETLVQMVTVGEQSATLDRSAGKLAWYFEQEVDHSIRRLTAVFEPMVIIFIGIMVAFVGLAILGPIFSLSQVVAGGS